MVKFLIPMGAGGGKPVKKFALNGHNSRSGYKSHLKTNMVDKTRMANSKQGILASYLCNHRGAYASAGIDQSQKSLKLLHLSQGHTRTALPRQMTSTKQNGFKTRQKPADRYGKALADESDWKHKLNN